MKRNVRKTISTPILNARKTGGKALCAVMMTAAFLGHQPSQGAASDALKSQSTTTSAESPDEDGGNTVESGPHEKLYGTWIANDVDAKMGEVKIKLTFRKEVPMTILAWSDIPFAGKVKKLDAPYEVYGETILLKAIRGGTTSRYSFEGKHLDEEVQAMPHVMTRMLGPVSFGAHQDHERADSRLSHEAAGAQQDGLDAGGSGRCLSGRWNRQDCGRHRTSPRVSGIQRERGEAAMTYEPAYSR